MIFMTFAHRRLLAGLCAGCLLAPVLAADAEQRRGGRSGGGRGDDRGQARGPQGRDGGARRGPSTASPWFATPWVAAPDIWPGPGNGPYSPLAAGRWGQPFGGAIFRGAQGWWPHRDYGFRTRWATPYYGFQQGMNIAPGLWSGLPVPFPAWQMGLPGMPGLPGMAAVPGLPGVPPAPVVPGYPGLAVVPGDPTFFMTPHPFYPPPAMWAVPPRMVPGEAPGSAADPDTASPLPAVIDRGGLSFELAPADAEVWVDGGYAGRADEFGPEQAPLPLLPGPHRLELRAPGHEPVVVDVQIPPGQVLPYRGQLQRRP